MTHISATNLGWLEHEDDAAVAVLEKFGVARVDLSLGRYFSFPISEPLSSWKNVIKKWRGHGIHVESFQSLFFGMRPCSIFDSGEVRTNILKTIELWLERASYFEVEKLVFGSPSFRFRRFENGEIDLAVEFFHSVGKLASKLGVTFLIEPNGSSHGCNFITSVNEAIAFAQVINLPSFRVNFDVGAAIEARENFISPDLSTHDFIGYCHVSLPTLAPIHTDPNWINILKNANRQFKFPVVSVEQLADPSGGNTEDLERSLEILHKALESQE